MPKSKVRKKPAAPLSGGTRSAGKKTAGPSHPVYVAVMLGFMLLGLVWLMLNYLAGDKIPVMATLGPWNFLIGFGLTVIGLLMTMRWR